MNMDTSHSCTEKDNCGPSFDCAFGAHYDGYGDCCQITHCIDIPCSSKTCHFRNEINVQCKYYGGICSDNFRAKQVITEMHSSATTTVGYIKGSQSHLEKYCPPAAKEAIAYIFKSVLGSSPDSQDCSCTKEKDVATHLDPDLDVDVCVVFEEGKDLEKGDPDPSFKAYAYNDPIVDYAYIADFTCEEFDGNFTACGQAAGRAAAQAFLRDAERNATLLDGLFNGPEIE